MHDLAMFDVVVLGAGAAGLMCAIAAARRGRRVVVLDHMEQPGGKILISGGGRCNFTNRLTGPENFFSDNPHFCRSALKQYTQHDFLALVEKHGIAWHEKTLGQLFCDGSARQIVAMLLAECEAAGVAVRVGHRVGEVTRADAFRVVTDQGDFGSQSLVLATGGLSIPKLGATDLAYRIAARFGLRLTEIAPALVPLAFDGADLEMMRSLSGVSLPVTAALARRRFAEAMLFTHRGLSGPAILQISSCWRPGGTLAIDLLPGLDAGTWLRDKKRDRPKAELPNVLREILPQRLAQALAPAGRKPMAEQPDRVLAVLAERLKNWRVTPSGSEGYAKAEVTRGGIDTRDLSSRTMEAIKIPGLYIIGEAADVTGWLGGYNFQWAWSSGWAAGMSA